MWFTKLLHAHRHKSNVYLLPMMYLTPDFIRLLNKIHKFCIKNYISQNCHDLEI